MAYSLYAEGMQVLTKGKEEEGNRIHRTLLCKAPVEGLPGWEAA
jgi:hypothetical protein